MLLGNYNVFNKNVGRAVGGPTDPTIAFKFGSMSNFYFGEANVDDETEKSAWNNGYGAPYAWLLSPKAGGLSSNTIIGGVGEFTSNIAGGKNAEASLSGSGSLSSSMQLIVSAVATLAGSGAISSNLNAPLNMVATLVGSGDITGALIALGNIISSLSGTGTLTPTPSATGHMEAEIFVNAGTASVNELVAGVWNAVATTYNEAGTMGEALNDAGSAGNPWASAISGNTNPGTFGEKVGKKLLTTTKFVGLK